MAQGIARAGQEGHIDGRQELPLLALRHQADLAGCADGGRDLSGELALGQADAGHEARGVTHCLSQGIPQGHLVPVVAVQPIQSDEGATQRRRFHQRAPGLQSAQNPVEHIAVAGQIRG